MGITGHCDAHASGAPRDLCRVSNPFSARSSTRCETKRLPQFVGILRLNPERQARCALALAQSRRTRSSWQRPVSTLVGLIDLGKNLSGHFSIETRHDFVVLYYHQLITCQLNLTFRRRRLDLADCGGDD
jgi:hypothetical protein